MPNTLLTIDMITNEMLRVLKNNLSFTRNCNMQYASEFAQSGKKIGNTISIRKPTRSVIRTGKTASFQAHVDTDITLTLDQAGVDFSFSSQELTLSIDRFSDRVIAPHMATVSNYVDRQGLAQYYKVFNAVGTPGTTPNALLTYLQAHAFMSDQATPDDDMRSVYIGPWAQASIVDALKGLFQSSQQISEQYRRGKMGIAAGFNWYMTQNVVNHVVGPLGGTPLVNGANQTGSSLVTDGWTAAAAARLNLGDVFTIAGVFSVNPQTRQSTGQLARFVVTANVSSDGSGNATIPIYPAITTSGAFQTVTNSPADNAALTVIGAASTVTPQNLAVHKDSFTCAFVDLEPPRGNAEWSRATDPDTGITIRVVSGYDLVNDENLWRMDVLFGWQVVYPELACRIMG